MRIFYFAQLALGVLGLLAGVVYINFLGGGEGLSTQKTMMYTIGPGGIGYFLPKYWVTRRVDARKEEITRGFPDCSRHDAGLRRGRSVAGSVYRPRRTRTACLLPALADEFEIVAYEMKAGKDKVTVLQRHGRTLRRAGCVVLRDRADPVGQPSVPRSPTRCGSMPAKCVTSA